MCGRFTLRTRPDALLALFEIVTQLEWAPRFNIAPTQLVLAIRHDARRGRPEPALLRWGLIPSWADDPAIGNRLINARAETLTSKSSFRSALRSRRCLVLADGFYEWKQNGKTKQPYFFRQANDRPFCFAGLWDCWTKQSPAVESCTILTTTPNRLVAKVHDRMPVILSFDAAKLWLDPTVEDAQRLTSLWTPYPTAVMTAFPVGREVNSPRNDSVACMGPAADASESHQQYK